jgi:hypothetical protein
MKFRLIEDQRDTFKVRAMCDVLGHLSGGVLRLAQPPREPSSRASTRSSLVRRSALIWVSRECRISRSDRGPSSKVKSCCARPHSFANIVARDNQIFAIIGPAPDDHVNVRMFCVPVIDGDPIEAGTKIAFGIGHEVARERLDIGEVSRIIRRDNETEMMAILRTPLRKDFLIGIVALGTEHPGLFAVLGHAVAAEIGKMRGKRGALHAVTYDPGLDHRRAGSLCYSPRRCEARGATPAESAGLPRCRRSARHSTGLFGGGERLSDKGFGALAPRLV